MSRRCSDVAGQIPELRARNRQQHALGERLAVNTVIQGTAADIIKVAMVRVHAALAGVRSRLILQIHDELMIEGRRGGGRRGAQPAQRGDGRAWELDPPLGVDVGVGENWLDAK